jgi:hypothetical protein
MVEMSRVYGRDSSRDTPLTSFGATGPRRLIVRSSPRRPAAEPAAAFELASRPSRPDAERASPPGAALPSTRALDGAAAAARVLKPARSRKVRGPAAYEAVELGARRRAECGSHPTCTRLQRKERSEPTRRHCRRRGARSV